MDIKELCLRDKSSRHLLGHKVHDAAVVPLSYLLVSHQQFIF